MDGRVGTAAPLGKGTADLGCHRYPLSVNPPAWDSSNQISIAQPNSASPVLTNRSSMAHRKTKTSLTCNGAEKPAQSRAIFAQTVHGEQRAGITDQHQHRHHDGDFQRLADHDFRPPARLSHGPEPDSLRREAR